MLRNKLGFEMTLAANFWGSSMLAMSIVPALITGLDALHPSLRMDKF